MQSRSILIMAVLLALGAIWIFSNKNGTDWYPYFESTKKSPYGTYILYSSLPDVFSGEIDKESKGFEWLEDALEKKTPCSYLFVGKDFYPYQNFQEKLQCFVAEGNNAMITAVNFSNSFLDTLRIKHQSNPSNFVYLEKTKDIKFVISNVVDVSSKYFYIRDSIAKADSMEILAVNGDNQTVFTKIPWGKGNFYLLSDPQVFSNIALLDTVFNVFPFACLSYLPEHRPLYVQEKFVHQSSGENNRSIFDVMKSRADLRMVYYLAIALILLFVLFRSKRQQRIIPKIEALRNTSLDFLQALSNLYYAKKDYKSVLLKRYAFLLDNMREKYYISTETVDEDFELRLSLKTGVDHKLIRQLFDRFRCVEQANNVSAELFMECNKLLERFYSLSKEHSISDNKTKSV